MSSKDLYEKAKSLIPGGVNSPVRSFDPYPFFIDRGEGSTIYDVDGNEYIDYCLGYGPLILGHNHPAVVGAVKKQLKKGIHFGIPSEVEVELAEKVVEKVPCADMVRFVNSGTEATMNAVRLARAYTGNEKILMFDGGYHGGHDHLLFDREGIKSPGIPKSLEDATLTAPYNDLEKVKTIIEKNELGGIIVEPVMGNSGCIPPEENFLAGLRDLCDGNETLLIFDEVITGFRLSIGGAQKYFDIEPDLVTLGKIIGGGFPIGAFGGRKEIMQKVKPEGEVYHAGTFSGHPLAMAAGKAVISKLEEEKILKKAGKFAEEISSFIRNKLDLPVNQIGPMFQVFFTEDKVKNAEDVRKTDEDKFTKYQRKLLEEGVFIAPSRFECCFVSGVHSSDDLSITKEAIQNVAEMKDLWE